MHEKWFIQPSVGRKNKPASYDSFEIQSPQTAHVPPSLRGFCARACPVFAEAPSEAEGEAEGVGFPVR
jgi:hypothetical protein